MEPKNNYEAAEISSDVEKSLFWNNSVLVS
jgi:hypothetical protein